MKVTRRGFVRTSVAAAVAAGLPVRVSWPAILSPTLRVDRDIDAVTGDGDSITLARAAVQELGDSLRGNLVLPGHPIYDDLGVMDYVALQKSGDSSEPRAIGSYTKTGFVEDISPSLIDAMIDGFEEHPERMTNMAFQHCGGAISRIGDDATAFPHRGIHATALLLVDWPVEIDPTRHIDWLRQYWDTVEPDTDGFYTDDVVDETQREVDENYLHNYPRLLALKNRYDPTNLLRLNANIVPTV